jgi:hypothetical protein
MGRRNAKQHAAWGLVLFAAATSVGCAGDFDTRREIPKRGSLGRELYGLVCDRVGAQALREDVTGASFRGVCHPNERGEYVERVDTTKLVPLDPLARDERGNVVPLDRQAERRRYRIARIEALGARREELVAALDFALPTESIPVRDLANPDPRKSCGEAGERPLLPELASTLGRLVDLYNDDTIPHVTRALADVMQTAAADPDAQQALARIEAREGYRALDVALGVVRPALDYPRLPELADVLLRALSLDADPFNPTAKLDPTKPTLVGNRKPLAGPASAEFQQLLRVAREELRHAEPTPKLPPLVIRTDALSAGRELLSRPRSALELARELFFDANDAYALPGASRVVFRDVRGVAQVKRREDGVLPSPFVDETGPDGTPDGLPDVDDLGRFVTRGGDAPTPFVTRRGELRPSDADGIALGQDGAPLYDVLDANRTFAGAVLSDIRPLFDETSPASDAAMKAFGALGVVAGRRETSLRTKRYGDAEVSYLAFDARESALVDLVFALGQIVSDPAIDELLVLAKELLQKNPNALARLVGVALELRAIAERHPEATFPDGSTFWDEIIDRFVPIAQTPGIMEDLVRAFADDRTMRLDDALAVYLEHRDELTYQRDPNDRRNESKLNGPPVSLASRRVVPWMTPTLVRVDRSRPDTGANRSQMQRFMQLLHDANGLAACTKEGAVAHIRWNGVAVDYPGFASVICPAVGAPLPPSRVPKCGLLRIENVAELIIDVALERARFEWPGIIADECLGKLIRSPLTGVVGGADAFLEEISGLQGFNTKPSVNAISRFAFFDTPYSAFPQSPAYAGDDYYPKTRNFFRDLIDPIPSMVCPERPFTVRERGVDKVFRLRECARFEDTLRGRDNHALFPIELMDFVTNVRPLAAAFADHGKPLLFVDLFDTLHVHWGTAAQTREECDPTLPRSDARWCSQDGLVRYEPMLAEMLRTDLFAAMQSAVRAVSDIKIAHCEARDANRGNCVRTSERDGVTVLAEALRVLVDPGRANGLTDRRGNTAALRNDGTTTPQVTPLLLFIDGLKAVDRAFARYASENPDDAGRLSEWRSARSQLVDTYFAVDGERERARFKNRAIVAALPKVIALVRAQVAARCPLAVGVTAPPCTWAREDLVRSLEEALEGPLFASLVDLVDGIRRDEPSRRELQRFAAYLLDPDAPGARDGTLAALVDVLQLLEDDENLVPLGRVLASALSEDTRDGQGRVVRRGFASAAVQALSRIFARAYDETGTEICAREVDPNRTLDRVIKRFVTPMPDSGITPIEVVLSVIADVNRREPGAEAKIDAFDVANIANEMRELLIDPARGLEQVWEVVRQATKNR